MCELVALIHLMVQQENLRNHSDIYLKLQGLILNTNRLHEGLPRSLAHILHPLFGIEGGSMSESFISGECYDATVIETSLNDLEWISSSGEDHEIKLFYSRKLGRFLERGPFGLFGAVCYRILTLEHASQWRVGQDEE